MQPLSDNLSESSLFYLNDKNDKINKIISKFNNEIIVSADSSMHASQLNAKLHELDDFELNKVLGLPDINSLENFLKKNNNDVLNVSKNSVVNDLIFIPVTPCRVADSRFSTEKRLKRLSTRLYALSPGWPGQGGASSCLLPSEILQLNKGYFPSEGAVALTVTAVNPKSSGNLSLYPADKTPSNRAERTSVVNYIKGVDIANSTVVGYSVNTQLGLPLVEVSTYEEVDVIIDLVGYYFPKNWRKSACYLTPGDMVAVYPRSMMTAKVKSCAPGYNAGRISCDSGFSAITSFYSSYDVLGDGFCKFYNFTDEVDNAWARQECCPQ